MIKLRRSPIRKALIGLGLAGLVLVGALYGIKSVPFGMIALAVALVAAFPRLQTPEEAWDARGVIDRKPKQEHRTPPKSCCG